MSETAVVAVLLAVAAALPYLVRGGLRTFTNLDDREYIFDNTQVLRGLTVEGIRWAFGSFSAGNWHPLTWISHMLDVSLFGVNPWGHHLTSVGLHALNCALLFVALRRMTGAPWRSGFAAALFGLHPLRVESVAWISERKDVLSSLFFMLVLLAYERYARRGGAGRYLAATVLFGCGLMAKPMLVTVPFVLLLLDLWPLGRTTLAPPADGGAWRAVGHKRLFLEKAPFLALSVASALVTVLAQQTARAVVTMGEITPVVRLTNAVASYGRYLGKMVWPSSLAIYYPLPSDTAPWGEAALAAVILVLASAVAIRRLRSLPFLATGWFWYAGMLVPVIGVVQVGRQSMADRYTYLPQIGLCVAVVWGLSAIPRLDGGRRKALAWAGGVAAAALAVASTVQVGYWKDSESIFRRTLAVTSGNWLIHNNLANVLHTLGRLDEAEAECRASLRIWPEYPAPLLNLATIMAARGQFHEAEVNYTEALRRGADSAEARNNLGNVLLAQGRKEEALVQYNEALRLRSDLPDTHLNLGIALAQQGRVEEAAAQIRDVLRLRPGDAEAHFNLANALSMLGRLDEAAAHYREALRLRPGNPEAHRNLGNLLYTRKQWEGAAAEYREALRLSPADATAHFALGSVLSMQGRHEEAVASYREALRLRPADADTHNNLGNSLVALGKREEGAAQYREALSLRPGWAEAHLNLSIALDGLGRGAEAAAERAEGQRLMMREPSRQPAN